MEGHKRAGSSRYAANLAAMARRRVNGLGCGVQTPDPPPGSPGALARGCLCDPARNRDGEGLAGVDPPMWEAHPDCPLHGYGPGRAWRE